MEKLSVSNSCIFIVFLVVGITMASCNQKMDGEQITTQPLQFDSNTNSNNTFESLPTSTLSIETDNLYEEGPWFVFTGWEETFGEKKQHFFIVNWDGSAKTQILPDYFIWHYSVQPSSESSPGKFAAVIVSDDYYDLNYRLLVIHLPEGRIIKEISLTLPDPSQDVSFILTNWNSLAWSPDGKLLAFTKIAEGELLDVFIFSIENEETERITQQQHENNAATLIWSPDMKYLAYESTSWGPTAVTSITDSIWIVSFDGPDIYQLTTAELWKGDGCNGVYIYRWLSNTKVSVNCPIIGNRRSYLLTEFDLFSGSVVGIYPDDDSRYWGASYSPETQSWLMAFDEYITSERAGNQFLYHDGVWTLIGPATSPFSTWWPEEGVFITSDGLLNPETGLEELKLPPFDTLISPNNEYWVFPVKFDTRTMYYSSYHRLTDIDHFWIGETRKSPSLINQSLWAVEWSHNSQSVLMQDQDTFDLYIAIAPEFDPQLISDLPSSSILGPSY